MFSLLAAAPQPAATYTLTLEGRPFRVVLTSAAQRALAARATPLVAEMEYYFSCMIRLTVRFYENAPLTSATPVSDKLAARFRPVMSRVCGVHESGGRAPLEDFPIVRRAPFVPHWLKLDYKNGAWAGEFGYRTPPS